jgi:hypothetical protein
MTEAIHRIFTATCIIGVPGSGKTSQYAPFARYLWEVYQKILLLYSWDGGAIPTDVQKCMKQGIIRFWRARTRSAEGLGLETLYLATKGYWPKRINVVTGECSPACELVPPVTVRYDIYCDKGHLLRSVPSIALVQPMFCPECTEMKNHAMLLVKEITGRTKGFELVGGVGFDGLTSMTNVVMDHMDHQRGAGQIGGEKPAFGGVVTSGVIKLGGNNRADVGFGQSRGRQFVDNSLGIPGLVEGPVFTALTNEATDEGGLSIVGLKLPGQAATDESVGWFGNVFEKGKFQDDSGSHHCLYLRPFVDAQNRRHLLKTSSSPAGTESSLPDKLVDPVEGQGAPFSVASLGLVFKMLDEDLRRACAEELPGAPGQPETMMEYGESTQATALPSVPVVTAPVPQMGSMAPPVPATLQAPATAPAVPANQGSPQAPRVQPRARRTTSPPAPPVTPAAPAQAPTPPAQPVPVMVAPSPATVAAAPATAVPTSGTAPPPPPGARPPQRAPGT